MKAVSKLILVTVRGALALGLVLPARAATETYKIQASHSNVGFNVKRFFTKIPGSFATVDGTIVVDRDALENSSVDATIAIGSVNTNDAKRDGHLKNDDFFSADKFPSASFKSTSWKKTGADTYDVAGNLTIKDVTKPVILKTKLLGFGKAARGLEVAAFEATTTLDRREFGITYGAPAIASEVDVVINIESQKQTTGAAANPPPPATKPTAAVNGNFIPEGVWRGVFDISE
ncbi:MAG TPA: YceI family protein, partial [Opitutus sp.]|nr:YceI family protein [Opitutus sp.]